MEKLSSSSARMTEALVGAALGGGVGAGVGALTHATQSPVEWLDENGRVQARNLTDAERSDRRRRSMKAALLGAMAGASGSMGGSAIRRSSLRSREAKEISEVATPYLEPLHNVIQDMQRKYNNLRKSPAGVNGAAGKGLKKKIDVASTLLREQEDVVQNLANTAASRRDKLPFGGMAWGTGSATEHKGLVGEHFDALARSMGLKKFDLNTRSSVFRRAVSDRMSKTAMAVFDRELLLIGHA